MKAKTRHHHRLVVDRAEPLPHEVGTHLFALIKRNLLARRRATPSREPSQLTFAF